MLTRYELLRAPLPQGCASQRWELLIREARITFLAFCTQARIMSMRPWMCGNGLRPTATNLFPRQPTNVWSIIPRLVNRSNVVMNRPATEQGLLVLDSGGDSVDGVIAYVWCGWASTPKLSRCCSRALVLACNSNGRQINRRKHDPLGKGSRGHCEWP